LRSELSLCQDNRGEALSIPRGFCKYSQRKWTGSAHAADVSMAMATTALILTSLTRPPWNSNSAKVNGGHVYSYTVPMSTG
jgi:hypothetical protein